VPVTSAFQATGVTVAWPEVARPLAVEIVDSGSRRVWSPRGTGALYVTVKFIQAAPGSRSIYMVALSTLELTVKVHMVDSLS